GMGVLAEFRLANSRGVLQHGLEHRLQLAGRAADDLQHLRGRGLLLQCLGELLFQVGVGCAKTVNVSSPLRCLRTKTGSNRKSINGAPSSRRSGSRSIRASTHKSSSLRPSALAIFRLMTSSYLVGACTGRSPGFSPLRMRST